MSFFSWFSKKSRQTPHAATGRDKLQPGQPQRITPEQSSREAERKIKRHANREQLYEAIPEAMTKAGVLSSRYKFKVLSVDPLGKDFLVMIDLTSVTGDSLAQPGEMEALIVQSARQRYDIAVSGVYWRLNDLAATSVTAAHATTVSAPTASRGPLAHEAIEADEVAAFQRALLAASAQQPSVAPLEQNVKVSSGLRFSAQFGDFKDTEVFESASSLALSKTQYDELR
ncbi:MAG: hypothetical protein ABIX00_04175 [Polaromonas sp.]